MRKKKRGNSKIMKQTIILNPTAGNMPNDDPNDLYFKDIAEIDRNVQKKNYQVKYDILLDDEKFSVKPEKYSGCLITTGSRGSKLIICIPPFSEQSLIYIRKFDNERQQNSKTTWMKDAMMEVSKTVRIGTKTN